MKAKLMLVIGLLLFTISLIKLTPSFSSDKSLYYSKGTQKFVYYNIDKDDFFNAFKDMIPGDIREDEVTIHNDKTNIYMKIQKQENDDINDNFVVKFYKNGTELNESDELIKICDESEESTKIKMHVEIPITVGNEIESFNNIYEISFYVEKEELADEDTDDDDEELIEVPKTYDQGVIIYYVILALSLITLISSIVLLTKYKRTID